MTNLATVRVHECAHAIAAAACGVPVYKLLVGSDGSGACLHRGLDRNVHDAVDARSNLRIVLAGPEAQAIAEGDYGYGSRPEASPDEDQARDSARRLGRLRGGEPRAILRAERTTTRRFLADHWSRITALARSLELNGDHLAGRDLEAALEAAWNGRIWRHYRPTLAPASSRPSLAFRWPQGEEPWWLEIPARLPPAAGRTSDQGPWWAELNRRAGVPAAAPAGAGISELAISAMIVRLNRRNVWRARMGVR